MSRTLVGATIAVAVLAIVAMWISNLPLWVRLPAVPCIAGWTGLVVTHLLLSRIRALAWQADGTLRLFVHDRRRNIRSEALGAIVGARVIGPLIVLGLRWPPRGRSTLWLLPDNLDADVRRRLRMRLGSAGAGAPLSGNTDSG